MSKKNGDLTIEILKGIRDEIRGMRGEIRATNERLDTSNERLERLERRQTESEIRLATELLNVAAAVDKVRDLLRENLFVRDRVDDHERRLSVLERGPGR